MSYSKNVYNIRQHYLDEEKYLSYVENNKLPKYLPKNSFTTLVVGFVRLNENRFIFPYSQNYKKNHSSIKINIPPLLLDKNNALVIDLWIDNLATCVPNREKSFIVDGKKLKSINQWFNKYNGKLQSIKDKQGYGKALSIRQKAIWNKRNNRVNDYLSKSARIIINYCLENDIGTLVCGYNSNFQRNSEIGKINNQNFVNIPFSKLEYLCEFYGIKNVEQEESYTSKASFFDMDIIPEYKEGENIKYSFSEKRIKRGIYKTLKGKVLNADINGALNILKEK